MLNINSNYQVQTSNYKRNTTSAPAFKGIKEVDAFRHIIDDSGLRNMPASELKLDVVKKSLTDMYERAKAFFPKLGHEVKELDPQIAKHAEGSDAFALKKGNSPQGVIFHTQNNGKYSITHHDVDTKMNTKLAFEYKDGKLTEKYEETSI